MHTVTALYSNDPPGKKNKCWHDGTLTFADGCLVLKDDAGGVLLRQHTPASSVMGKLEFTMSRFSIQLEEPLRYIETPQTTSGNVRRRGPSKFIIKYKNTTSANSILNDGIAEYDGKSLVVFKDANMRVFHKKICPGIAEGETITSGPYIIEVIEEQDSDNGKKNIYTRKTLVCKTASAAAHDPADTIEHAATTSDVTSDEQTVFKCIFTEDKQKKQKKWIDGVLKLDSAGLAVIESEESGEVVLKRHFKNTAILKEGYEFDGGKYRFQITESPIHSNEPSQPVVVSRKRLMTVSEIRSRKEDLLAPRFDDNTDFENLLEYTKTNNTKKAKTDSMFDIFDD